MNLPLKCTIYVTVLTAFFAEGQQRRKVYQPPPPVGISFPNRTYPVTVKSLRDVDFANFSYSPGHEEFNLKKGAYERSEPGNFANTNLDKVWPFDLQAGEPRHTLVSLNYSYGGGSSNSDGDLFVFELRGGHPVLIQEMCFNQQAPGAGAFFTPTTGKLTIKVRKEDGSPHCCPKTLDLLTYIWTAKGFVKTGASVVPIPPDK